MDTGKNNATLGHCAYWEVCYMPENTVFCTREILMKESTNIQMYIVKLTILLQKPSTYIHIIFVNELNPAQY